MTPPKVGMSFAVVRKKTPFQKAKEEEELKRKRDAADAARLLGDFEESFADAKKSKGMTFVSAGVQGAGSRPGDEVATKGRGKVYAPAFPASEMDEPEAEVGAGEVRSTEAGEGTTPAPGTSGKGSKPRAIDALMGEMMAKQRERELARLEGREVDPPPGGRRGSRGNDEKNSTNLFVGNLPRDIEEHALMMEFAKYGPIASVKNYVAARRRGYLEAHAAHRVCGLHDPDLRGAGAGGDGREGAARSARPQSELEQGGAAAGQTHLATGWRRGRIARR